MINLTSILHLVMGISTFGIFCAICISYRQTKNIELKRLMYMFVFFAVYSFSLSIPPIAAPDNPDIWGKMFIVGAISVFFLLWHGIHTEIFLLSPKIQRVRGLMNAGTIIVGFLAPLIFIIDFRTPVFDQNSGFIFWNLNSFAAWSASTLIFLLAMLWAFLFSEGAHLMPQGSIGRKKAFAFALMGALSGLAGLIYFPSSHPLQTGIAFASIVVGVIALLTVLWYSKLSGVPSS